MAAAAPTPPPSPWMLYINRDHGQRRSQFCFNNGDISVPLPSAVLRLSHVRYIPSLSAYLSNFGQLVRQGWRYSQTFTNDGKKDAMLWESQMQPADYFLAVLTDDDILLLR